MVFLTNQGAPNSFSKYFTKNWKYNWKSLIVELDKGEEKNVVITDICYHLMIMTSQPPLMLSCCNGYNRFSWVNCVLVRSAVATD